jgi:2-(1,2-epoxy-1,2-dihydrophenyl)acetyl-CoA isomerase
VTYDEIRYEEADAIATITLNRPAQLNAMGPPMRKELTAALRAAETSPAVRVAILTGAGRAFSSGADIGPRGSTPTVHDMYVAYEDLDREMAVLRELRKPVIAAVNGLCYGYGLMLAALCDLVVASDRATFSMIEARMGSSGATTLPYLVGPQWAKLLMLAGDVIGARTAERIGLVVKVVPHDRLAERVTKLARRIAAMPPAGVLLNKRAIDATMDIRGWTTNTLFHRSHAILTDSMVPRARTPDGRLLQEIFEREGFAAFKQARDAAFREPWADAAEDE